MNIKSLRIRNFRNLKGIHLSPGERVNVLFGENAQGKTNFIEAIYYLSSGRSFRPGENEKFISLDESVASLEIKIEKNQILHEIKVLLQPTEKRIILNEKKITKSTLTREFSTVLFSPDSLSVIKNSDQERRDLIDDLVISLDKENAKKIEEWRKIFCQRNKLLRDFRDRVFEINPKNVLYLETLTQKYLQSSAEVVIARLETIRKILPLLEKALSTVFTESFAQIGIDYLISDKKELREEAEEIIDAMYNRWLQLKSAEIKLGYSLVGPHKHDISVLFNEKDSRFYCSQGQQRLIILAFKIAQIGLHFDVHGTYPILLLDDVLSEIDESKRMRLMEYLEGLRAQIFITTTESTVLKYLHRRDFAVFDVEKGVIREKLGQQEELSV